MELSRSNVLPPVILAGVETDMTEETEVVLRPTKSASFTDVNESIDLEAQQQQQPKRLRAGAAPVTTTVDNDDDDDEISFSKGTSKPPEPETKPESTLKRGLNIFKIVLLFFVWVLATACLMISEEHTHDAKLLSVPAGQPKEFLLPEIGYKTRLGIFVQGPFVVADDLHTGISEGAQYLSVHVERVFYDDANDVKDTKVISDVWKVELVNSSSIPNMLKHYVFTMNEAEDENFENSDVRLKFTSDAPKHITIKLVLDESPIDKNLGILFGSIILLGLYIMIVWEIINRTFASMVASTTAIGVLGILNGRPSLEQIMTWIDVETLLLLFGMMILVAVLSESGIFDYLAVYAYKITRGRVWPLVNCLCLFTAVLSSFLDNVTMMLLITPVTIRLCEVMNLHPVPILMAMVIYSNVGAAMTPVGDPPNVIITTNKFIESTGMNFGLFILHMCPGVLLAMVTTYFQLRCKYRKVSDISYADSPEVEELRHEILVWERLAAAITALSQDEEDVRTVVMKKIHRLQENLKEKTASRKAQPSFTETLEYLESEYPIRNKPLLYKSSVVFVFVIMLFFLHSVPNLFHLTLGWTALLGAILLLILADMDDMQAILAHIEWSTLLFFASLFILMECLTEMGLIEVIGDFAVNLVLSVEKENRLMVALLIIIWITSISSAFLDNIPVTTMMVKIIISLSQNKKLQLPLHPLVWALGLGACFGGNGTLIGASANVVCAGVAEQHGYKITFLEFFKVGFPIVIGSTLVATFYLLVAHVAFEWH